MKLWQSRADVTVVLFVCIFCFVMLQLKNSREQVLSQSNNAPSTVAGAVRPLSHTLPEEQYGSPFSNGNFSRGSSRQSFEQYIPQQQSSDIIIFQCESRPPKKCGNLLQSKDFADLVDITAALNLRYARLHGYDYLRFTMQFTDRHPAWCKIWVMSLLLEHYQYVLYLDSDAVFHSDLPLERSLDYRKHLKVPFILGERPHHGSTPNTGMWMARSCPHAVRLFEEIWRYPADHPQERYNSRISLNDTYYSWPWELASFSAALKDRHQDLERVLFLMPRFTVDHPRGKIIRHLWSIGNPSKTVRYRPPEYLSYIRHRLQELPSFEQHEIVCSVEQHTLGIQASLPTQV